MSPLPLKKELSASQPIFEVCVSPAGLEQTTVTPRTINSGGVAKAGVASSRGKKAADVATNSAANGRSSFILSPS
jgi:hypothetical protein